MKQEIVFYPLNYIISSPILKEKDLLQYVLKRNVFFSQFNQWMLVLPLKYITSIAILQNNLYFGPFLFNMPLWGT